MQKYFEPEFNIFKVITPDVITTSGVDPVPSDPDIPLRSERDNAYLSFGDISGSMSF